MRCFYKDSRLTVVTRGGLKYVNNLRLQIDEVFPMEEGFRSYIGKSKKGFVQGNFSPISLLKPHSDFLLDFDVFLKKMKSLSVADRTGWICSLNHGVLPKTPEINVRHFIQAIREQFSGWN